MVISSLWIVPISHITVLLSHSLISLFFYSHLTILLSYWAIPTSYKKALLNYLLFNQVIFLWVKFSHQNSINLWMRCTVFSQNYQHVCWTMLGALHVMRSSPNLIKCSLGSLLNKSRQVSLFAFRGRNARGKSRKTLRNTHRESSPIRARGRKKKKSSFLFTQNTRGR